MQFAAHLDRSQQHASRRSHTHEHRVQPTSGPSREHDSFDFTGFDDFDDFNNLDDFDDRIDEQLDEVDELPIMDDAAGGSDGDGDGDGDGCGDDDEAALARRARWLDLHRGPRKGKEWWQWWMMRRRIAREKAADPSG